MIAATRELAELVHRYDRPGPRYTSYPTVPEWVPFTSADYSNALRRAVSERPSAPLSLYVHVPFCREMCSYCGCNVVIAKDPARADTYLDHVAREIALAAALLGGRRGVAQLHWGGGTPTFLDEDQLRRLFAAITAHFTLLPGAEVAIEVDPVVTSHAQLDTLRALGFNRLSMGVQDFTPEVQRAVNRVQSAEETADLLAYARRLGFKGINVDLIYGLPFQKVETFRAAIQIVAGMLPDRAAVYSYAHLPELRPHQRRIPEAALPRGVDKVELFLAAHEVFTSAGYAHIGMDHFARPEDELARAQAAGTLGRNFQGYTVRAAPDTVSFGITGIGEVGGAYVQSLRPLPKYYRAIREGAFAVERGFRLVPDDRLRRDVINALMCNFRVDLAAAAAAHGERASYFAAEYEALRALERDGLVRLDGAELTVTPLGRLMVRNVAMVFDAYLRRANAPRVFSRTV